MKAKYFRRAAGLAIGLVAGGVILAIALAATYSDANAGLPILFFGGLYAVLAVPVCLASAVMAALSLKNGEGHQKGAIFILIVMGAIAWMGRSMPFSFVDALIEGYLQRPWP